MIEAFFMETMRECLF